MDAVGICSGLLPLCPSPQCDYVSVCFIFSSSKQGHDDSLRPGDGVGVKHRTRQTLHVALFRERPAAGRVPHQRRRLWPAVSFAELSVLLLFGTQTALLVYFSSCPPNFVPCIGSVLCERNCYLKPILKTVCSPCFVSLMCSGIFRSKHFEQKNGRSATYCGLLL